MKTRYITKNNFQVIKDPSNTFPEGGFFRRYDFLLSLSGEVWPEGMIVMDFRRDNNIGHEFRVHYRDADREGKVNKFLISTETGMAWRLRTKSGFKLIRYPSIEREFSYG